MAKKGTKSVGTDDDFKYTGANTIELIRLLIRYDIPVLLNGKSSIGKSYTMIAIAKEWKLPNQILYVGSEKSEHIEGLPKLVGLTTQQTLEYLQPYWFPSDKDITSMVTKGRNLFNDFRDNYLKQNRGKDFKYSFDALSKLLELFGFEQYEPGASTKMVTLTDYAVKMGEAPIVYADSFKAERDIVDAEHTEYYRDDLRDICVYLCTLLGYGNFWLLLDEIDKVEPTDVDKYAPMLHIVRERWLKKWKLQPINEGKGVNVKKMVTNSNYANIKNMIDATITHNENNPDAQKSLLDTRIIAIANKTGVIEEALFRRFMQVIVEEILNLRPSTVPPEEQAIKECIDKKLDEIGLNVELSKGLDIKLISDVNLQWTYNFFPKLLNMQDLQGNFIIKNYREVMKANTEDPEKNPTKWESENNKLSQGTMLYKIIRDNFGGLKPEEDDDLRTGLFSCLSRQIAALPAGVGTKAELVEATIVEALELYGGDTKLMMADILEKLEQAYPEVAKENKGIEVKDWIDTCIMYLRQSIFKKGKFQQTELSKILIPNIMRLIYMKIAKDKDLAMDVRGAMIQDVNDFWEETTAGANPVALHRIQINGEEVQKVMYGDTIANLNKVKDSEKIKMSANSIMGAGKFTKTDIDTTNAYKNSLSFLIANDGLSITEVLKYYTQNLGTPVKPVRMLKQSIKGSIPFQEYKEYPAFIKYIKDNHAPYLAQQISLWKKGNPTALELGNEIESILK